MAAQHPLIPDTPSRVINNPPLISQHLEKPPHAQFSSSTPWSLEAGT